MTTELSERYGFHFGAGDEPTFFIDSPNGKLHCIVLPNGNVSAYAYHRGIVVSPEGKIAKSLPPMIADLYKMDTEEFWTSVKDTILEFMTKSEMYQFALAYQTAKRNHYLASQAKVSP